MSGDRLVDRRFAVGLTLTGFPVVQDTITPRAIPSKPSSDLRSRLMPPGVTRRLKEEEGRLLTHFVDLLDKMLSLEPARRPSPKVSSRAVVCLARDGQSDSRTRAGTLEPPVHSRLIRSVFRTCLNRKSAAIRPIDSCTHSIRGRPRTIGRRRTP